MRPAERWGKLSGKVGSLRRAGAVCGTAAMPETRSCGWHVSGKPPDQVRRAEAPKQGLGAREVAD